MSIFSGDKKKKEKKPHEPTNAEINMKALQGIGAYEEDENDAARHDDEDEKARDRVNTRPQNRPRTE